MNHQQGEKDVLRAQFTKWLDVVCYRVKLKYLRKTEERIGAVSFEELPEGSLPIYTDDLRKIESTTDFDFEEERLADAFAKLPLKQQQILTMLFVEEKKPQEIARELNCPARHVYDQRYQGLKRLRMDLTKERGGT